MNAARRILLIHTAFIGDVILALPVLQTLRRVSPNDYLAVLVIPETAPLLENHPAVDEVFIFDKKGEDKGIGALRSVAGRLQERRFDIAIVPHRSLRSALLARLARIPVRVGFSTSAGRGLFTVTVPYDPAAHEIDRDLALLAPLGISPEPDTQPKLNPGHNDVSTVDLFLRSEGVEEGAARMIALAPGSIWATKRWPAERYAELARILSGKGYTPVLVGGPSDAVLCRSIVASLPGKGIVNAAGRLSLLQSAELISRCMVTVSNDSAPMHLSVAVNTPVVAVFGPTVPGFGFAPRGGEHTVVEVAGLLCRPCGIHGGNSCPVSTFDCMLNIVPDQILHNVRRTLHGVDHFG